MMSRLIVAAILLVCFGTGLIQPAPSGRSLEGAWNVVEVQRIGADGHATSIKPRESLVLFAQGHYSFCWTSHRSSVNAWQIADTEQIARFNQTLINAGTYSTSDSLLVTHAEFAWAPKFTGGSATFRYTFSRDTLVLTGVSVVSTDKVLHPTYAGGGHIINKLVKAQ
jgi:hypothetical protein